MVAGIDFTKLLQDPNMLMAIGDMGQSIGAGEPMSEALNPSGLINRIQNQKAIGDMMRQILAQGGGQPTAPPNTSGTTTPPSDSASTNSGVDMMAEWQKLITPTPIGTPGPDKVDWSQTADGTTMKVTSPSANNLATFGKNVPPEAMTATPPTQSGGSPGANPFFKTLLGLE